MKKNDFELKKEKIVIDSSIGERDNQFGIISALNQIAIQLKQLSRINVVEKINISGNQGELSAFPVGNVMLFDNGILKSPETYGIIGKKVVLNFTPNGDIVVSYFT